MFKMPGWLKWVATGVAIVTAAILVGGLLMVSYRSLKAPHGYDQPRIHLNTKNSTRFAGSDVGAVAGRISRAVYPATSAENRPDVVILYAVDDWAAGLVAATLLRPLNAVLLPATASAAAEIERLGPAGSPALGGSSTILVGDAEGVEPGLAAQRLSRDEVIALRNELDPPPRHALLVSAGDPGTALLAAPWAAYSGDLVILEAASAPADLPLYGLGDSVEAEGLVRIAGRDADHTAVKFAAFEDPRNPLFGWGMNADSPTGYRAYILAPRDQPALALAGANLARRGKPGPLLWSEREHLPQVVNNYFWSQRAAFWVTPSEGPFHHFWIVGDTSGISFPAQGQADYAVEIGPYLGKGVGASGIDFLAAAWVLLGLASALWIVVHQARFLPSQNWVMGLAWPLLALMVGPFGLPLYYLAYSRPVIRRAGMMAWDRPLWLQGLVATVSAVGFGASLMITTGFVATTLGVPLYPGRTPFFYLLGTPMILIMILNYVVAVLVSWLLFQTPMLSMFYGLGYRGTLFKALPMVLLSMAAAALAMNPGMWWLMMSKIPMMPTEESVLWFGVMFFTAFLALLMAWPLNYLLVRRQRKSGLM